MRLTEKSQVTVPKHVREHLGVGPGSEVDFQIEDSGVRIIKVEPGPADESPGERLVRVLRDAGKRLPRSGLSSDEIMEMSRGPFDDVDSR